WAGSISSKPNIVRGGNSSPLSSIFSRCCSVVDASRIPNFSWASNVKKETTSTAPLPLFRGTATLSMLPLLPTVPSPETDTSSKQRCTRFASFALY
ncbi:hypothetical protein PIB30_074799, partial [Stylosanthes scabra]|nr:hypothetical protein [Stylosanthes scabra]